MTQVFVGYSPKILRTMAEICEEMGVGAKLVKRWLAQGAPIAVEGTGTNVRYSAKALRLQMWREQQTVERSPNQEVS